MARLEISKTAIRHNIASILSRMHANARFIAILKDNAYGHGAELLGEYLSALGVKMIAVKNEQEAGALASKFKDILILSQPAARAKIGPFIYAINDLNDFAYIKNAKIMLKIDSGMSRSGIRLEQIASAIKSAKERNCKLLGAFTHYSSVRHISAQHAKYLECAHEYIKYAKEQNMLNALADELASSAQLRTNCPSAAEYANSATNPAESGNNIKNPGELANIGGVFFHSAASYGVFAGACELDNAARVGLAMYGYVHQSLQASARLFASKISQRVLEAGDLVGYDETFCAPASMHVANYDLGYADGLAFYDGSWPLEFSGAKVLGKFSMDSFSLDVVRDEVCVFADASQYARAFNISVYEALVRLGSSIDRQLVD